MSEKQINTIIIIGCIAFSAACLFLSVIPTIQSIKDAEIANSSTLQTEDIASPELPPISDIVPAIPYLAGALVLFWVIDTLKKSGTLGTMLFILSIVIIAGGVGYYFLFGQDTNGDGQAETQWIGVVQMDGNNVERDMKYSAINETSTKSNARTALSVGGYVFLVYIGLMVGGGIWVVSHFIKRPENHHEG